MYYNKAIIIGNITKDPELKALPSGGKVASFSVATNRVWKDQSGEKKEQTDFHNVIVFGRQAESVAQYMKKGSQVMVDGRMQTRAWDAQDGSKRYRMEIVADRVQFGSTGNKNDGSRKDTHHEEKRTIGNTGMEYPDDDINADEIPF